MNKPFADSLKQLRAEHHLSQQQLADMLFVDRTTVTNWELGRRVPDASFIVRLADIFGVDVSTLLDTDDHHDKPHIIMVDNERIILMGSIPILKKLLPDAELRSFTKSSDVLIYAQSNRVDIALLDIEIGQISGFNLCRELLKINPKTNVIFLTAYADYAFDAWSSGASGFLLKPLTEEALRKELLRLRYPVKGLLLS